ncbi:MAG: hypothetical protein IJZ70_02340 [Bacteroidales bacterium]|nr:hypothetical protein [Bacteroidales bacterium]
MKRLLFIICIALAAVSCSTLGKHVSKSPAQKYCEASNRNTVRAWGFFKGYSMMDLESEAANVAREKLAAEFSSFVHVVTNKVLNNAGKGINNEEELEAYLTLTTKSEIEIPKTELQFTHVVMTDRYIENGNVQVCYAAVEMSYDTAIMLMKTSEKIKKQMDKLGIDMNSIAFVNATDATKDIYSDPKKFDEEKKKKLDIRSL